MVFIRNLLSVKVWFAAIATIFLITDFITGMIWSATITSLLGYREYASYRYARWENKDSR